MRINQMQPSFDDAEVQAIIKYMQSGGWLTDFKKTRELEGMLRDYTGAKYCSIVSSGTMALQIALMAMGLGRGSKVICPAYSMVASAYAINLVGAEVVFVDVNKETYNINKESLWDAVKKYQADAIMHVSINGRSSGIDEVLKYSKQCLLIEDACQAIGSRYNGKHLGTFGDIGVLSLNTFKLVSQGQAGVLITDNEPFYQKIIRIKDYGRAGGRGSQYEMLGMNGKVSDLNSVVGIEQMKKLPWRVGKKKLMWKWYKEFLKDVEQVKFIETNLDDCAPWFYDPLVENRDGLMKHLADEGIETQAFYPAIHKLPHYANGYVHLNFPNADYISEHGIWLPSSVELEYGTVELICEKIKEFYKK